MSGMDQKKHPKPLLRRMPFGVDEDGVAPRLVPLPGSSTMSSAQHSVRSSQSIPIPPPIPIQDSFESSEPPPMPSQDHFGSSEFSKNEDVPPMPRKTPVSFSDHISREDTSAEASMISSWRRGSQETFASIRTSDGDSSDFSSLRPPKLGDRTQSTAARLSRQGFVSSGSSTFAVRHIQRGSEGWNALIKPFVADLAFRSLVSRRYQSEVSFRPYTCQAAVLFIDLSSYSKITAAIAHRGAHELSNMVNAYLTEILKIAVDTFGGDVVKFAGDAVLIVWDGKEEDLRMNLLCAAKCAMEVQNSAGSFPVEGTMLEFRVHCGLCCGLLESEIFEAPTHVNMQRLYHSVGGESLYEISELVDLARAGEVCLSETCVDLLGDIGTYRDVVGQASALALGAKILTGLEVERSVFEAMGEHIESSLAERIMIRNKRIEEDFIHPTVLRLLTHGGHSPNQISEMRNLCVLFIAMTSNGSSVNWLMEVQGLLDVCRCPIVQIIDDDKGVHIVAAVNLYETVPEASVFGLEACRKLADKQVGCAIGVAMGPTFCGVTGSNSVACRWDITGPPAVRAARLMQYALANDLEVAVDESIYAAPAAASRLQVVDNSVILKGSKEPVTIYSISESTIQSAFQILGTDHGRVHDTLVEKIRYSIEGKRRSAVVVSGIPYSGKKIVCQRAAGRANFVPFLHISDQTYGLLQLARTMATWFKYSDVDDICYLADSVLEHMDHSRWSCAHDQSIRLVDLALLEGLEACFVVDRVQFLDEFSISLMRECLRGQKRLFRSSSRISSDCSSTNGGEDVDEQCGEGSGRICFLCVHVALYNWKTAVNVVEDITRSRKNFHIPIFEVLEAGHDDLRRMFRDLSDMEVEDRWLDAYAESSGFCAGYFIKRAAASRNLSGKLWSEGKEGLAETSEKLVLSIPPGLVRNSRLIQVSQVCPDATMRFHQIYDELPPLFQMLTKVLSVATGKGYFKIPRYVVWETLNDLIAKGVEANTFSIVLDELVDMFLLKIEFEGDENVLSFRHPALGNIAYEVCTPVQIAAIRRALLERLEPVRSMNFRVPLVMAQLYHDLREQEETKKELWRSSYEAFKAESAQYSERETRKWMELIEDEIEAAGYQACDIVGDGVRVLCPPIDAVPHTLPLLKIYSAPVAFGPMGHSLSVITRNTFHEWGAFHGAKKDAIASLRTATASAAKRYLREVALVEGLLSEYKFGLEEEDARKERSIIQFLAKPAVSTDNVKLKARRILEEFVPQVVESRLKRLHLLIEELRKQEAPDFIRRTSAPIKKAYFCLKSNEEKCRQDSAQHALMILATMNWKPRRVPEYLPLVHYQTVANVRNKTLTRLSKAEAIIFRHQQKIDDLECFLVLTALL